MGTKQYCITLLVVCFMGISFYGWNRSSLRMTSRSPEVVYKSYRNTTPWESIEETVTTTQDRPKQKPEPRTNLYFMKTHKTGSSTMQNILVRYAWDNGLIVGLPRGSILFSSYWGGRKFSSKEIQPLPQTKTVNMLFHHMVFNYKEVSSLLPDDAAYVTILRDPATLFRSAFHYFRNDCGPFKLASKDGLEAFLKEPSKYFKGRGGGQFWWLSKNGMFYDLGFDNLNETSDYIEDSIKKMNETFDLVMIIEYFDMSLILLKSIMRWDIKDVAYVSMNARKTTAAKAVPTDMPKMIYDWNKADAAIYKFFNQTFWDRVKSYGEEKMRADLNILEYWKSEYQKSCFQDEKISNKQVTDPKLKMFNPPGIEVMQYQLRPETKNNDTCIGLILPELQWWKKLSTRQRANVPR